jgi:cytochrome c551/c552
VVSAPAEGKVLIQSLDCKACHKAEEKSIGPSYTMVADKYAKDNRAVDYLSNKIIKGGGGVWGEVAMAAHPDLKPQDAVKIVNWILSLKQDAEKSLPANGAITATEKEAKGGRLMQITATYTDKGSKKAKPLTGGDVIALKYKQ